MTFTLAVLSWLICASCLVAILRHGLKHENPGLISFAFILLIQTSVRPLIFFSGLDLPQPQTHIAGLDWEMMVRANVAIFAWTAFFLFFYIFFKPLSAAVAPVILPYRERKASHGKVLFVTSLPTLLGVGATLFMVAQYGGIDRFVYASKINKDLQGFFIIQEACTLASLLAIYGVILSLKRDAAGRVQRTVITYVYVAIMIVCLSANYIWGNRYNIALLGITFLGAWHFYVSKLSLLRFSVYGLLVLTILIFLGELRVLLFSSAVGRDTSFGVSFWRDTSNSLHFAEYDALMLALRDGGVLFEFRAGADFLNGLVGWVPRFIYEQKESYQIGPWFRQLYQPLVINGWPVTTIGSWYVNFAYFGIPLGAAVSGFVVRCFDVRYSNLSSNAWSASIGLGLCFLLIEGGYNPGFPQRIVLFVIPLWAVLYFLRLRLGNRHAVDARPVSRFGT